MTVIQLSYLDKTVKMTFTGPKIETFKFSNKICKFPKILFYLTIKLVKAKVRNFMKKRKKETKNKDLFLIIFYKILKTVRDSLLFY